MKGLFDEFLDKEIKRHLNKKIVKPIFKHKETCLKIKFDYKTVYINDERIEYCYDSPGDYSIKYYNTKDELLTFLNKFLRINFKTLERHIDKLFSRIILKKFGE